MKAWKILAAGSCSLLLLGCQTGPKEDADFRGGKQPVRLGAAANLKATPLAAATAGTGYVKLAAAQTGIDFNNTIANDFLLLRGANLTGGLASGDYDNDGRPDLYFGGLNAANELYHNEGGSNSPG
jgi:hypothetical protein